MQETTKEFPEEFLLASFFRAFRTQNLSRLGLDSDGYPSVDISMTPSRATSRASSVVSMASRATSQTPTTLYDEDGFPVMDASPQVVGNTLDASVETPNSKPAKFEDPTPVINPKPVKRRQDVEIQKAISKLRVTLEKGTKAVAKSNTEPGSGDVEALHTVKRSLGKSGEFFE